MAKEQLEYIDCEICGKPIYEHETRIKPIGGLIRCVDCWRIQYK